MTDDEARRAYNEWARKLPKKEPAFRSWEPGEIPDAPCKPGDLVTVSWEGESTAPAYTVVREFYLHEYQGAFPGLEGEALAKAMIGRLLELELIASEAPPIPDGTAYSVWNWFV